MINISTHERLSMSLRCCILALIISLTSACREPYRYATSSSESAPEYLSEGGDEAQSEYAGNSGGDSAGEIAGAEPAEDTWLEATPVMRKLTEAQYRAQINIALGKELTLTSPLPPDLVIDGSKALGTTKSVLTTRDVEQYAAASAEVASLIAQDQALLITLHSCAEELDELETSPERRADLERCLSQMVDQLAVRLWGRALSDLEQAQASALIVSGLEALERPRESLEFPISWLLQSPYFLFRVEEVEPTSPPQYTPKTLAERLSYFLLNTTPDATLYGVSTELMNRETWSEQVDRLLASPLIEQSVRALFDDLWSLWKLEKLHLNKDPEQFEHLSAQLGYAAREETLMGVWRAADDEIPFPDLLTQRDAYLNRELAALYGVAAPAREGFGWTIWPNTSARIGLLGQVSFLALNAHPTASSSTLRGYFVLDKLLCSPPPPPPAGVDTSIPEPTPERPTLRDRLVSHLEEPSCAACHRGMDMIGLTFEGFDGLGRARRYEQGVEIDPSGELLGVEVSGPLELAQELARHPKLATCLVRRTLRYARGIYEDGVEEVEIEQIADRLRRDGFTIKNLLRAIALSEGFHGPYREDQASTELSQEPSGEMGGEQR